MSAALDQLLETVRVEHAQRIADAHRVTAARCRALGYERVARLFERMALACGEPAKLARASAALEGPALRVVDGGLRSPEPVSGTAVLAMLDAERSWGGLDDKEPA